MTAVVTGRPRLRGVSHQIAFFVSLFTGSALIVFAHGTAIRVEVAVYAASLSGLFGVSALLHRRDWPPKVRRNLRRLDHSMIFVLIAGTYTPIAGIMLDGGLRTAVLLTVWIGALAGVVLTVAWIDAPKWAAALPYVALGWVAVVAAPQLLDGLGVAGLSLVVFGGVLYTAGAVVYARKRPDPIPAVFGYHEVFHALVIAAAAAHYAVIAGYVLPAA
ncbi:MAG TPA: hemolysin III family protein [Acidimicrobiia bacterium]|nr:hemolysin III family protein [Acidimicrobiia bacterium]